MSDWLNLSALLNDACQQTFGEPVVYQPAAEESFTVTGSVDRTSDEERQADGVYLRLLVRLADFTVPPACGDEVTIGLAWVAGGAQLGFVSSGCSLCRASASIMIAAASAKTAVELGPMIADFRKKFSSLEPIAVDPDPTDLGALYDLRRYPSRQRCVLLAWDAIAKLLYT